MVQVFAWMSLASTLFLAVALMVFVYSKITHRKVEQIVPGWIDRLLVDFGLYLGFLVAMVSTVGSLYLSEVQGLLPCLLCWYQRILMYPQAVIISVAMIRNDRLVYKYILPLSIIGMAIAIYHYSIQFGGLEFVSCIAGDVSCTEKQVLYFGFMTIPLMSVIGFLLTSFFTYYASLKRPEIIEGGDI